MTFILKTRRDWSLLLFEIRRDKSPHKIWKIRRDWSLPFGEIGVPPIKQSNLTVQLVCTKALKLVSKYVKCLLILV